MNRISKKLTDIFARYLIMVLASVSGLWIFYFIFTPLTVYPVYFILNLFFDKVLLINGVILINSTFPIELVKACIAGSAYYLLLILNLATPKIVLKKRIKILAITFLSLLVLNILRIILLSSVYVSGSLWFNSLHMFFWYFANIVFVVGIWFFMVKRFKIKTIPFYSDMKFIKSLKKKTHKSKYTHKHK